jgi:hypothetical protein
MVSERDAELMRYEECVKDYKELLGDLTLIKQGKDLSGFEFVSRCDDLINEFKTIKYLDIVEEQARTMAINDLLHFISEVKGIKPRDF